MALLMLTSTLMCGVLLQTVTRILAAEKTRAWVEFHRVITQPPQVVPVRHALMTPSICNLGRNFFKGCLSSASGPSAHRVVCNLLKHWRFSTDTFSSRFAFHQATGKTFPTYKRLPATTSATHLHF